jgi:hypothetical protein
MRRMNGRVNRRAVDFSQYPELVVIYLGMRVVSLRGLGAPVVPEDG